MDNPSSNDIDLHTDPLFQVLAANPSLLSLYLLQNSQNPGQRYSRSSMTDFLLWFAVYGRHAYPNITCFGPGYLGFLDIKMAEGTSILFNYARQQPPSGVDERPSVDGGDDIVARYGLGPFLSERPTVPADTPGMRKGVSILGFHRYALGIGEDARTLFEVLRALGFSADLVDIGSGTLAPVTEAHRYEPFESTRPIFPVVIVCAPLFEMARVLAEWGPGSLAGRYVIGYWPWELTTINPCWHHLFDAVDEIWASTTFLKSVYEKLTAKPVFHVPLHVAVERADLAVQTRYGLRMAGTTFLSLMDFNSTMKRKNAIGTIRAFKRAFAQNDSVSLVIKTVHGETNPDAWAGLLSEAGDDARIQIIDGAMSRPELCGLIATADVFVSLHRAEGFGRVIAEAMLLGTVVMATDWSGSRDFLNPTTGYPIRYKLVQVDPGDYPEAAGVWAEPDLGHAQDVMQLLHREPQRRQAVKNAARAFIKRHFSRDRVVAILADRFETLS